MVKIRTIIVDDEPLARERLSSLLANEEDFEIVCECENGKEAIESIESLTPDLVFLDIQMPEVDGFDVILSLDPETIPDIIFVTAYDKYAVKAFEVHALDYLLKPFDRQRFSQSLNRIRTRVNEIEDAKETVSGQLANLLSELKYKQRTQKRLLVKSAGRIMFVSTDEVEWIEAAGNYMRIHAGDETYLMRETMAGMENRLPKECFVRIHRSYIVNFNCIKELQPAFNGEYTVILHTGQELKLSRKYRSGLEEHIGKTL